METARRLNAKAKANQGNLAAAKAAANATRAAMAAAANLRAQQQASTLASLETCNRTTQQLAEDDKREAARARAEELARLNSMREAEVSIHALDAQRAACEEESRRLRNELGLE